jgi:hypothetical protein
MSEQITLTLPTAVYQQAEALARQAGRPVAEVLVETIEQSLRSAAAVEKLPTEERTETPSPADSPVDSGHEPLQWTWSKDRQRIYEAIRTFSEQTHADY